jgi:hypothetical protein
MGGGGGNGRATGAGFFAQALAVIAVTTTAIVSRLASLVICFPGARKWVLMALSIGSLLL